MNCGFSMQTLRTIYRPFAILLLLAIYPFGSVFAQSPTAEADIDYQFGEWIKIHAMVSQAEDVKSVQAFIQTPNENNTWLSQAVEPENGKATLEFNPQEMGLRAFSDLEYWVEVVSQGGEISNTPKETFYYEDNRFEWKTLSKEPFEIFWHEGDSGFGLSLLDVSQQGLNHIQTILPVPSPEHIRLYAYANAADMRATLQNTSQNWVGAHTDPDLGVMVVSLPPSPEQRLEMERQIPHELMHLLLYQKVGQAYVNLPPWLNEGLSSIAELFPNSDYQRFMEDAYKENALLPISQLCKPFPRDAAGAYLAYAEAASFTRYLHEQYGSLLIDQLVRQYANGLDCERGIEVALGSSMDQLEREWRRETLGEDPWLTALTNLAPWLLLLFAILAVPIILVIVTLRGKPKASAANR